MPVYYKPPPQKPRIISATPLLVQPLQQWIGALPRHARQIARPCLSCKLNPLIAPWSSCTFNPAEGGVVMVIKAPHGWHEHEVFHGSPLVQEHEISCSAASGSYCVSFDQGCPATCKSEEYECKIPGLRPGEVHLAESCRFGSRLMSDQKKHQWWKLGLLSLELSLLQFWGVFFCVLLQIHCFESPLDLGVSREGQTIIIASFRPPLHTSPIKNIQESTVMNCHPNMMFLPHLQFRFTVLPGRCELLFSCAMPTCVQRDGSDLREQRWCGLLHAQGPT